MSEPVDEIAISLQHITKRFGDVTAVDGISLDIRDGEFLTLLGPSGCGKTTTMRMIAGFEEPDDGRVLLRGREIVGVPPNKREVNMVFQHYALFPHMTVEGNVEYGLKLKKVPKDERRQRVGEMLEIVGLGGYQARKPSQLSGGQQQRVALARALVNRPTALLLDEPLGALDVKLRKHMQLELKRIQHELRTTFVYVTHDQDEALSMSDRIAVMNAGVIEQIGAPRAIYQHPETPFVADFVGVERRRSAGRRALRGNGRHAGRRRRAGRDPRRPRGTSRPASHRRRAPRTGWDRTPGGRFGGIGHAPARNRPAGGLPRHPDPVLRRGRPRPHDGRPRALRRPDGRAPGGRSRHPVVGRGGRLGARRRRLMRRRRHSTTTRSGPISHRKDACSAVKAIVLICIASPAFSGR